MTAANHENVSSNKALIIDHDALWLHAFDLANACLHHPQKAGDEEEV